jgi:hypothetical protein
MAALCSRRVQFFYSNKTRKPKRVTRVGTTKKKTIMKTKLSAMLIVVMFMMATQPAHAKIRRVGYPGTPIINTDYTDLQSAHDAAAAGDTLLIFPGSWGATYSKKLVTLGYGYLTDTSAAAGLGTQANPGLQNIKGTLSIQITVAAGSDNCTFEGLDGFNIYGDNTGATLTGIIIRRCSGNVNMSNTNIYGNWQILQCFLNQLDLANSASNISNITVNNSYIYQVANAGGTPANQSGQFNNCVLGYTDFNSGSFVVKNTIFGVYHNNDAYCVYQYDLFDTNYGAVPFGPGNIGTDDGSMQSIVFVGVSNQGSFSNDGRYALTAGSPAKGAGQNGTDMGMYGGANPYKLSGIPRIPSIYKLTAPSTTTSGNPYTITASERGNN